MDLSMTQAAGKPSLARFVQIQAWGSDTNN